MVELAAYGIPAHDALGAAQLACPRLARLERRSSTEGAPADFVVYDRNPLDDLTVLRTPSRVVLRGAVVA